jgi:hypothetical protein
MALFLSDAERRAIDARDRPIRVTDFYWALQRRADGRAANPGLLGRGETQDWWRPVFDVVSMTAMAYALKRDALVGTWLRDVSLSLCRRPASDWVGPAYRDHGGADDATAIGHLETAHLCWSLAVVLDLAGDCLAASEHDEVRQTLRRRGVQMLLNWLDREHVANNWWSILASGLTVTAVVLGDEPLIERGCRELAGCAGLMEADGSFGESLQYGNYYLIGLTLASEALRRSGRDAEACLPPGRYMGYARWAAASHLHFGPADARGSAFPRAVNFNDSAALFRPSADVLLHMASRGQQADPQAAGLARWLFDTMYASGPMEGHHGDSSFGIRNNWGFLTLPLLCQATAPASPTDLSLAALQAFDCGTLIARDRWGGRTVLAMQGGGASLRTVGHLHADLNSIQLSHNGTRLLVDAGHSCYRNVVRELELGTNLHNTCTFTRAGGKGGRIEQATPTTAMVVNGVSPGSIARGGRRLLACGTDDVRVLAGDAGDTYGDPIQRFARFVFLCGSSVVFVVDHVVAAAAVVTRWNWLLNNADGQLDLKPMGKDRVVVRRGNTGMKLFTLAGGGLRQRFAHLNDAYHCMPGQSVEGRSGSGVLVFSEEPQATLERVAIHAMAMDSLGGVADWHLLQSDGAVILESGRADESWALRAGTQTIRIEERRSGRAYVASSRDDHAWTFDRA